MFILGWLLSGFISCLLFQYFLIYRRGDDITSGDLAMLLVSSLLGPFALVTMICVLIACTLDDNFVVIKGKKK